jgi:hypothetical protein
VYKSFLPKSAILPVASMMFAVLGLALSPELGFWRPMFAAIEIVSIIAIIMITSRSLKNRKKAWDTLDNEIVAFIEAAQKRYKVTLTETILYAIAQGGTTLLTDKNGALTRIMLTSDPEARTTKLMTTET